MMGTFFSTPLTVDFDFKINISTEYSTHLICITNKLVQCIAKNQKRWKWFHQSGNSMA